MYVVKIMDLVERAAPLPSFNHVARQFSYFLKGMVWKDFLVIFFACSFAGIKDAWLEYLSPLLEVEH